MTWWCSATGQEWEWVWRFYPGGWLFMLASIAGWWRLVRGARPGEKKRAYLRGGGTLLFVWLLLDWPVGTLGAGYLVSVHAIQFLGLAFLAAPLLLLSVPATRWEELAARAGDAAALRAATHPVVTGVLFNLIVLTTHLPSVVDALMVRPLGAFLIDAAWIGGGLLFWWPIIAPVPARRGGPLGKIVYLFAGGLIHTGIGVWFLLSRFPIYGAYELAPPIGGRSALVDQGIAGGLMELLGGVILISAIAIIFFRWARVEGNDADGREAGTPLSRRPATDAR